MLLGKKLFNSYNYLREVYGSYRYSSKQDYYLGKSIVITLNDMKDLILSPTRMSIIEPVNNTFSPFHLDFGMTMKKCKSTLGKPNLEINHATKINGHSILFYKKLFGHNKLLVQFHFFNNKLMYICNEVLTDTILDEKIKNNFLNLILKPFYGKDIKDDYSFNKVLKDSNNNIIYFENSVRFSLNYLSGDQKLKSEIIEYIETENGKRDKRNERINRLMKSNV